MPTLYPKLAITGMAKNKQLYIPYFLACSVLMAVFYITAFLARSEFVYYLPGGEMISVVLDAGWIILSAFSAVYMFYMNSFLLKRRKTEFGLYNVLGMGKSNIMLVLVCEVGMVFAGSFLLGTGLGILFSKLVEVLLVRMLGGNNTYDFGIDGFVVTEEFCVFLALFGIILVRGMRQIRLNDSIQLLRSQNQGDEPPKANLFLTILGIVLLIAGYVLANIVKSWIWAIMAFFGAVLLVIAATYILFVSGSTIVCGLLKKNTRFYYKKNHFFAVSQISSRMKKNGAGLASICILSTMVLVSFSAVGGLYFGAERILRNKYPRDIAFQFVCDDRELVSESEKTILDITRENGIEADNIVRYRYLFNSFEWFYYRNNKLITHEIAEEMSEKEQEKIADLPWTQFYYIPISDYNSVMGKNLSVNRGEALILRMRSEKKNDLYDLIPVKGEIYTEDQYDVNGKFIKTKKYCDADYFKCVGSVSDFVVFDGDALNVVRNSGADQTSILRYVFLNDEDFEEQFQRCIDVREENKVTYGENKTYYLLQPVMTYYFGADLNCSIAGMEGLCRTLEEEQVYRIIYDNKNYEKDGKEYSCNYNVYPNMVLEEREELYSKCKGILFLGAMFCVVLIAAAILMMYYKQITEGHEDKSRFRILRQVGMTEKEVRSTISSQVLIMFFMPLIVAGVHTIFAFGLISKLIMLIGRIDVGFLALVTLICFLGYAVIYTVAYKLTSKAYYSIIS